jgi:kynureninase
LDESDPLAGSRKRFLLPDGVIYLDGNSLGALPAGVPGLLHTAVVDQWGDHLITAWNDDGWWTAPLRLGDRVGRLLGAAPGQTIVGDSTSVQLFNALAAGARLRPDRTVLLVEAGGFPTDRYLAASVGRLLGLEVHEVPMAGMAAAVREHGHRVAVVTPSAVDYRTGELWPLAELTAIAHEVHAVVVWDLCHAVGAMPVELDSDRVDIAVGCTYKFLSGGPGAPAFLYVAKRHQDAFDQPLRGWMGHAQPFETRPEYVPAQGIARARIGTPPMLSMLAVSAALDVFDDVDLAVVRAKSLSLGEFFIECADANLARLGFEVVTPRDPARRGSQITLRHPEARPMMAALIEHGVIGDVRPPDLLRFGLNALYVSHTEVLDAIEILRGQAESEVYLEPRYQVRKAVQ